jgi:hypothetical protein
MAGRNDRLRCLDRFGSIALDRRGPAALPGLDPAAATLRRPSGPAPGHGLGTASAQLRRGGRPCGSSGLTAVRRLRRSGALLAWQQETERPTRDQHAANPSYTPPMADAPLVPSYVELLWPTVKAIRALGGSTCAERLTAVPTAPHDTGPHRATELLSAITDEVSPLALRSTRNPPRRAVRRGAADRRRSGAPTIAVRAGASSSRASSADRAGC